MFQLVIHRRAQRTLQQLPREQIRQIYAALELLRDNPLPPRAKKLKGSQYYRVQVGDLRIIYSFERDILQIFVLHIGHRREVYRALRD